MLFFLKPCYSSNSGREGVKLQTIPQSLASQCGDNVKLTCEGNLSQPDIKLFAWVFKTKSCRYNDHQSELCETTHEPLRQSLTLTLLNVMPVDQGEYLCKLHSKLGVKSQKTIVTVQGQHSEQFLLNLIFLIFLHLKVSNLHRLP